MPGLSREQWQGSVRRDEGAQGSRPIGVCVTATSTEVGKTVVASALARTFSDEGKRVAVFKPALTGLDEFPDYDEGAAVKPMGGGDAAGMPSSAAPSGAESGDAWASGGSADVDVSAAGLPDHATLRVAARSAQTDDEICPYRFDPPMSPHLAAGLAGVDIDPDRIMAAARAAADGAGAIVCEGVGGLLVPLAPSWNVRSFAVELGYPLVIVSPPGLGAINHTLLTVESARSVGLRVAAIVLNPWPESPSEIERDNRETIAALGGVPVLTLPRLDLADPRSWPPLSLP